MCISAAIIAGATLLASGVAAYSTMSTASANAGLAKYENALRTKQLREKRDIERLAAIEKENLRTMDFARTRSSQLAAIGASGLGENISFFQGIDPDQQQAYLRDIRNVRLGLTATEASIADEIQVGAFGVRIAKFNAGAQKIGALADFAKTAMQAATFYNTYRTPSPAGGGP